DTSTSTIATLAAGEVRLSGVIEPAEVTLVSPLQSVPCVYYRATIDTSFDGPDTGVGSDVREERAVGFRVRDPSGDVRVFPRGARWDAPLRFDESTGTFGSEPTALSLRAGPAIGVAELDREAAIAALLTVQPADRPDGHPLLAGAFGTRGQGQRHYREARLEPGDAVTIVGQALPFGDLSDPAEADVALGSDVAHDDAEVAADLAEAREAGLLADTPEAAWGNAAIPGFGIGRPARAPDLDPDATSLPIATADETERTHRRFAITPETLVLAATPDVPLLIAHGLPAAAVDRHEDRFVLGLLGAVLAIGSAMTLAVMISGGIGR
ncbi:MAG: hypothetical protein ACTS8Z_09315, partial [Candidatus Limnocylindrales bacterium]